MEAERLTVAMITDVFSDPGDEGRLLQRLEDARERRAGLVVLPELPMNKWVPVTQDASDEDAEPPGGPRQRVLAEEARAAGLSLLGGAIVRDPDTARRHNTAVLVGADGADLLRYRKVHLPNEEGFWEGHHYEPGDELQPPVDVGGCSVGVQICSDVNRPEGCQLLGAMGADVILVPRATPPETYDRWRLVLRANAVMSCAYVISVNRPGSASGAPIGGPSLAIAPNGDVLVETDNAVSTVTVERTVLEDARTEYPGYLDVRADVYENAWRQVREGRRA